MSDVAARPWSTAPEPPKGSMMIIFFIVLMDLFGFGVIIPLLPFYAEKYDASPIQVTILFSIYSLCQLVASPLLGTLSDRFGRRPVLILSQLGSVAGYALLAWVTYHAWTNAALALMLIYASRVIDGLSGGNISTAQAYISDVTSAENRAKGMGMLGAAFGIGFALGPFIGGVLGDQDHNAHLPAVAAACFSFLAMALTWAFLPESHHPHRGALARTSADPVDSAPAHDAEIGSSPATLDYQQSDVIKPNWREILRRPMLLQLMSVGFITMTAFVMMEASIAMFVGRSDTFAFGPKHVGYLFALAGVVIIVVQGFVVGRVTQRLGEWPVMILGALLVSCGMAIYVVTGWKHLISLLVIAGIANATGRSLFWPTLSSLVSKTADRRTQGMTFGIFQGLASLGRVIGPLIAGVVYERHITGPFAVAGSLLIVSAAWTGFLLINNQKEVPNDNIATTVESMG